ncbi:hypothetical protein DUNSADRAFT_4873 [Dunaliella salina]|uniref:Encoded protein n=1 Tax=Dunaliella salina TaxID=3046 RepID=A0ABQ7GR88_DUNSA|nr:hypothetical protein DUNSADRAFT_4873 [Dunaliella salina]|eukprot:KAF5837092.1 hypothetical protein DUNSADRAFT_4873 [Dunaliella salina]
MRLYWTARHSRLLEGVSVHMSIWLAVCLWILLLHMDLHSLLGACEVMMDSPPTLGILLTAEMLGVVDQTIF